MIKDNKGFSLIEFIIVLAIMAVLSGLAMLTFNSVNRSEPQRVRDNVKSYAAYSSNLVRSDQKDLCMAIILADDHNYYAVQGLASGDTYNDIAKSFKSIIPDELGKKKYYVGEYEIDQLLDNPGRAYDMSSLGKRTTISYKNDADTGGDGECTQDHPLFIKFRKFDGSVLFGSGEYTFTPTSTSSSPSTLTLEASTGSFHK